jgi:hypothetical protein
MERESQRFAAHNLGTMTRSPRLTRSLRKSNRLLIFIELGDLSRIIKLGSRVRSPTNNEPRLPGLSPVVSFLLCGRVRSHVVHDDVHICPDVQMAQLQRALERDGERCKGWAVVSQRGERVCFACLLVFGFVCVCGRRC